MNENIMKKEGKVITILLADDDPDDRQLTRDAFAENRLANMLNCVEDGEELMEYLQRRGRYTNLKDAPLPGLILLDLNMTAQRRARGAQGIKADLNLRRIPIVVLTTSKAEEDILRTYDLGVNSYITKPVTFKSLVELIKLLGRYWFEVVDFRRTKNRRAMPDAPVKVLLVDDDEDDYVITRDLISQSGNAGITLTGSTVTMLRCRHPAPGT